MGKGPELTEKQLWDARIRASHDVLARLEHMLDLYPKGSILLGVVQ